MKQSIFSIIILVLTSIVVYGQQNEFLYGLNVYPEYETQKQSIKALDYMQKCGMNVVRLTDASWGNIETSEGTFNFDWAHWYLDEVHKRGMKAILSTGSFIAPQWLFVKYPDLNVELRKGEGISSFSRKAACIFHPGYRKAMRKYIEKIAIEFKDHPTVIGWQLDNEIDNLLRKLDYNKHTVNAWTNWLKKEFGTAENFNQSLSLHEWAFSVKTLDQVSINNDNMEGHKLPQISLLYNRFQRDEIANFFQEQKDILRKYYPDQSIMTDVMATNWAADNNLKDVTDYIGLNFYPASKNGKLSHTGYAKQFAYSRNIRSNYFMISETRIGVMGSVIIGDPVMSEQQFITNMLLPVAYGANGILYWTGTRNASGHWPMWGGLFDWTGEPEPDYAYAVKLGAIFNKYGDQLVKSPVDAKVAFISDYDQIMLNMQYPITANNLPEYFSSLAITTFNHAGISVDVISPAEIEKNTLDKYSLVIVGGGKTLGKDGLPDQLENYTRKGGTLYVGPLTNYTNDNGVFSKKGFCTDFQKLTGGYVQTIRQLKVNGHDGKTPQTVLFKNSKDTLTIREGFCEIINKNHTGKVLATFQSYDSAINQSPALVENKIGKGKVYQSFFVPERAQFLNLISKMIPLDNPFFEGYLPDQSVAVQRTDSSMFILNMYYEAFNIKLKKDCYDRLSGKKIAKGNYLMNAYETIWIE
jgi:beta-galactosidase